LADGTIVQFLYGDDSLDPLVLEKPDFPIDLKGVSQQLLDKNWQFALISPLEACDYLH
jgi:hypothetical protein